MIFPLEQRCQFCQGAQQILLQISGIVQSTALKKSIALVHMDFATGRGDQSLREFYRSHTFGIVGNRSFFERQIANAPTITSLPRYWSFVPNPSAFTNSNHKAETAEIMTGKRVSAMGSKVELTLQSIHGIVSSTDPHDVMAGVSFTGSASSMQVSSSSMCTRTGNLVIESNGLELDPNSSEKNNSDETSSSQPSKFQSFATFNDPLEGRRSLPSGANSTSSSASSQRPHLQLKLSGPNANTSKRSLSTSNRGSTIQQNPSLLEDASILSNDCSRGASIHWEHEGDAMPDIVELHVVLRNADHSIRHEGVAHLVFYGNQREMGTTTMDLRIKKNQSLDRESPLTLPKDSSISFAEDSFIRVQVEVSSADNPAPSPEDIVLSENFDEEKIGNIMSKLKEHEEMAAARAMNYKMGVQNEDTPLKNAHRRAFCNAGIDFRDTFRAIVDAFTRCDGRRGKSSEGKSFMPILRASSTMESTIATRDSLLI